MIGAIIGDVVGSRFEHNNYKAKDFELFGEGCFATDDSILTLAIAQAILEYEENGTKLTQAVFEQMHKIGAPYPKCGYGLRFYCWLYGDDKMPYNSCGNGAAMRVSACGWAGKNLDVVLALSDAVTAVTHNHPEGLKGARATAAAIYLARTGSTKEEIRKYIEDTCEYKFDFTIDEIRPTYRSYEDCQRTVPQALQAFFEAESFEDTLRIAISLGGDSDTIAAIACSVAEAYYGVPTELREAAEGYLDENLLPILRRFEEKHPPVIAR